MGGQIPDPVAALREIAFWMERDRAQTHRVKAYRRAADVVAQLPDADFERYRESGAWQELSGIGPKTAAVIEQACAGAVPQRLAELRSAAKPIAPAGGEVRALLRGDLHTHSDWSDGGSPIEEMMRTAQALGHEYCALTDHSPRLTVANGLSAERLRRQLDVVAELNERLAPFRILTGIEVDILDDGTLDQEAELLARLDIVVASVHSNLRADSETMTKRMVYAVANPNVDVLGHCTGRLVAGNRGIRPESSFDAELVFEACRRYGTAVEINSRPERLDPPSRLLRLAVEMGCYFSIDTDAHAPGQLDWQGYGCERAAANEVPADRIINSLPLSELLEFTAR
ncbi:PHP domain-containing protein [Nocardia africana]|uniref:PHP domain-containing protein n=1 Tax=Nocardia africana TaxID=134964 RepID=A0ABW6NK39_9NOCA